MKKECMMASVAAEISVVVLIVLLGVRKDGEKRVWRLNPRQGLSLFGLVIALIVFFRWFPLTMWAFVDQERLKTQIKAQKRVIEAKANQEKAAIDAEIKVVEAKAQAKANRMIASSVTDQLIEIKEAEARMAHG